MSGPIKSIQTIDIDEAAVAARRRRRRFRRLRRLRRLLRHHRSRRADAPDRSLGRSVALARDDIIIIIIIALGDGARALAARRRCGGGGGATAVHDLPTAGQASEVEWQRRAHPPYTAQLVARAHRPARSRGARASQIRPPFFAHTQEHTTSVGFSASPILFCRTGNS